MFGYFLKQKKERKKDGTKKKEINDRLIKDIIIRSFRTIFEQE